MVGGCEKDQLRGKMRRTGEDGLGSLLSKKMIHEREREAEGRWRTFDETLIRFYRI